MLLFRGKMFIKSKVVCIDLHAGPNEGRYGDLIVLQMHQRGLAGFLLSEWLAASCCYCPSSHWLNCLSHSQGTYWMQRYKTVLHNRPKLAHISENRNVIFLKSRGEIFPSLMFQFTTVPDPILLLSWKKAEYRPSESISSPENSKVLFSAPRSFLSVVYRHKIPDCLSQPQTEETVGMQFQKMFYFQFFRKQRDKFQRNI